MANYKAIVQYHFKKGMEEQGLKFLDKELIKKAQEYGCHGIELCQNEKDHTYLVGIALWNDIEDARRFQSLWDSKERELLRFCTSTPKREFFRVRDTYTEKMRKAA